MDEQPEPRLRVLLWLALGSIIIGGMVDLILDRPQDWFSFHVIFEALMIAGALLMAMTLWLGWSRAERSLRETRQRLHARQAERDAWKQSAQRALEGLGAAIDAQFSAWSLTPAEREVALLLLKGYSHKHIARLRTGANARRGSMRRASTRRRTCAAAPSCPPSSSKTCSSRRIPARTYSGSILSKPENVNKAWAEIECALGKCAHLKNKC